MCDHKQLALSANGWINESGQIQVAIPVPACDPKHRVINIMIIMVLTPLLGLYKAGCLVHLIFTS